LITAMSAASIRRMPQASPQDISSTAWAFAKQAMGDLPLYDAIAMAAQQRITQFNGQELANTAWAFATKLISADPLMETIAEVALSKVSSDWRPQELANTAWAYARLGILNPTLFDAIADRLLALRSGSGGEASNFTVQELVNRLGIRTVGFREQEAAKLSLKYGHCTKLRVAPTRFGQHRVGLGSSGDS